MNLARAKACELQRIVDCLIFLWERRLDAGSFKSFPAPTVPLYFDQCHDGGKRSTASPGQASLEVALLTNRVCLSEPSAKVCVYVAPRNKPKGMDMVAGRNGLNLSEPGMFESASQHDVTI